MRLFHPVEGRTLIPCLSSVTGVHPIGTFSGDCHKPRYLLNRTERDLPSIPCFPYIGYPYSHPEYRRGIYALHLCSRKGLRGSRRRWPGQVKAVTSRSHASRRSRRRQGWLRFRRYVTGAGRW